MTVVQSDNPIVYLILNACRCENLHHSKGDYHTSEPCPVVERVRVFLAGLSPAPPQDDPPRWPAPDGPQESPK